MLQRRDAAPTIGKLGTLHDVYFDTKKDESIATDPRTERWRKGCLLQGRSPPALFNAAYKRHPDGGSVLEALVQCEDIINEPPLRTLCWTSLGGRHFRSSSSKWMKLARDLWDGRPDRIAAAHSSPGRFLPRRGRSFDLDVEMGPEKRVVTARGRSRLAGGQSRSKPH
ncbi:hypothetical protein CONLIGDRAFT_483742 [Coniochaeta ligniaria NRRL 30616]|uniref:Uncharacterized protein n=1 Tax=Coniochaeta ligniaria NRRL 30616 TaxID=1408157 RepID=A0A1J7IG94_9PEZI|nr:hypothetical protein CONLIGDRAFT_483742 [Coniochaeta ligniaria NRRL 30616]